MTRKEIEAQGWTYSQSFFRSWAFTKGNYRLQYLYDKGVMYVAEKSLWDLSDNEIIYRGACPDVKTFKLLMGLLFID